MERFPNILLGLAGLIAFITLFGGIAVHVVDHVQAQMERLEKEGK
jgi:cell division protein FtsB